MTWWAVGIFYGEKPDQKNMWSKFRDQCLACNGYDDSHKSFFEQMNRMELGDIVVARATYQYTKMYVRGVGVVTKKAQSAHSSGFGQCVEVEWFVKSSDGSHLKIFDFGDNSTVVKLKNHNLISAISAWLLKEYYPMASKYIQSQFSELENAILFNKQLILQGPPGTGKTYLAKQLAAILSIGKIIDVMNDESKLESDYSADRFKLDELGNYASGHWSIVQFHPSYNYEDFVRGIQISTPNGKDHPEYKTINKIFGEMIKAAQVEQDKAGSEGTEPKSFVLIIDEINRAHVAAVLGELIYGLEYRNCPVDTPYDAGDGKTLTIPKNIYVIGTMNTADRSIGHIDYAVRRRFAFETILPNIQQIEIHYENTHELLKIAIELFSSVAGLFIENPKTNDDRLGRNRNNVYLSRDFQPDDVQIGHTYFMVNPSDDNPKDKLLMKMRYQVIPILKEYVRDGILLPSANEIIEALERKITGVVTVSHSTPANIEGKVVMEPSEEVISES